MMGAKAQGGTTLPSARGRVRERTVDVANRVAASTVVVHATFGRVVKEAHVECRRRDGEAHLCGCALPMQEPLGSAQLPLQVDAHIPAAHDAKHVLVGIDAPSTECDVVLIEGALLQARGGGAVRVDRLIKAEKRGRGLRKVWPRCDALEPGQEGQAFQFKS